MPPEITFDSSNFGASVANKQLWLNDRLTISEIMFLLVIIFELLTKVATYFSVLSW